MSNPSNERLQNVRRRERPRPISASEPSREASRPRVRARPTTDRSEYDVGYGKPPKHSQFKPGQSGNPKGRPKGAKSPFTLLQDELQKKAVIKEKGKLKTVTNLHAIMKRLIADTLGGKPSATKLLFTLLHLFEAEFATALESTVLPPEDQELVLALLQGFDHE